MTYSSSAMKSLKRIAGIRFTEGRIDTDSLETNDHRIAALKRLCFIKTTEENFIRFEIGRVVNSIPDPKHGDRTKLCRELFGSALAENMRQMAWAAERWMRRPDVGWPWSFYRYTATCSIDEQDEYIRRYQEGGLTIEIIAAERRSNVTRVTFQDEEKRSTSPFSLHVEQLGVSIDATIQQGSVNIVFGDGTLIATLPVGSIALFQQVVSQLNCLPIREETDEEEE